MSVTVTSVVRATVRDQPVTALLADLSDVECHRLVEMCEYHRIGVTLADALAREGDEGRPSGDPSRVPALLESYLHMVRLRQTLTDLRVRATLTYLDEALSGLPHPWLIVKGPALVSTVGRGRPRDFRDLDVLVRGEDLGETLDRLTATGSTQIDRNYPLLHELGSGELSLVSPSGLAIDLHWNVIHERRVRQRFRFDTADLIDRSVTFGGPASAHRTLDPLDSVLYIALHACLAGGERLLWAHDLARVVEAHRPDPGDLRRRSEQSGIRLPVAVMLDRTASVLRDRRLQNLADALAPGSWWREATRMGARRGRRLAVADDSWDRGMYRSTRVTDVASVREWGESLSSRLRRSPDTRRPWLQYSWDDGNPLHLDLDAGWRARFLRSVREECAGIP